MEVDYDVQRQELGVYRRTDITMIGIDVDENKLFFFENFNVKNIVITTKL